ncbi:MAG: tetratricopeptide repeat protein [Sulfuricurvum sp.]|nr:tetratricopeptide repeat protein [Sulfuricurvum sp.]
MLSPFFRSLFILAFIGSLLFAGDFEEGLKAAQKQDFATAHRLWLKAAEQGDARAQNNLGLMYKYGDGALQDYAKAMSWCRKSAKQGYAEAQSDLAMMYENGDGVAKNLVIAHALLRLAAASGDQSHKDTRDLLGKKLSSNQSDQSKTLAQEPQKLWALIDAKQNPQPKKKK